MPCQRPLQWKQTLYHVDSATLLLFVFFSSFEIHCGTKFHAKSVVIHLLYCTAHVQVVYLVCTGTRKKWRSGISSAPSHFPDNPDLMKGGRVMCALYLPIPPSSFLGGRRGGREGKETLLILIFHHLSRYLSARISVTFVPDIRD